MVFCVLSNPIQITFFLISACNSKCVTVWCSGCFVLCYALHFVPYFFNIITKSKSEHITYCLIQYQNFMSSAYLPFLTCKHYFVDLQEVGGGCGDWMELAQDRDRCRALVSTVMKRWVPWNAGNFLTSCRTS